MDRAAVESALSISPPIAGKFAWSPDSTSFLFHFDEPFNTRTNYTVRISATARDSLGATLDGDFDGKSVGLPADDYIWTFRFPLPNDDLAQAELLAGSAGSVQSNNRYASLEIGEPFHATGDWRKLGSTVWYRWTAPPEPGWFTFDLTRGTSFDSLLAVYTGDRLTALVAEAGNDNYGTGNRSHVSLATLPQTSYAIVVASKDMLDPNQAGPFTLSYPTPPPSFNSSQFAPRSGLPGAKILLTGTNFTGTTAVLFNGASAFFTNAASSNVDLRITAVVPPDATPGTITIVTPHGNVTSTVSFQVLPPPLSVTFHPATGLEISWPAASSSFVLEVTEDLGGGSWIPVAQAPVLANGKSTLALAAPAGHQFYRLKTK